MVQEEPIYRAGGPHLWFRKSPSIGQEDHIYGSGAAIHGGVYKWGGGDW